MARMKALAAEPFEKGFGKVNKSKPVAPKNPTTKGGSAAVRKMQASQSNKASKLAKVVR